MAQIKMCSISEFLAQRITLLQITKFQVPKITTDYY